MSYFRKNSNTELVPQSEGSELATKECIKKKQPEIGHTFSVKEEEINYDSIKDSSSEVITFHNFNEPKSEITGFVSDEQEINKIDFCIKDEPAHDEQIQLLTIDSIKMEIETCTEKIKIKKELEDFHLHEEIEIKSEIENELEDVKNTLCTSFACCGCCYKTANWYDLKQHQMIHSDKREINRTEIKKELEELHMHEEIEIKSENEGELEHSTKTMYTFNKAVSPHLKDQTEYPQEKPFACNQCDYKTTRPAYLKQHKKLHSGEKPFACNLCDYKAVRLHCLKQHKMTHSGEKPLACNLCDYKTISLSNLKRHQMQHSREKPFACKIIRRFCRLV